MSCIIIIGGGVAGFQAAAACRAAWPERAVTLIDKESEVGYYRALLPQFMVGALAEEKLFFRQGTDDPLLNVRTGAKVKYLDRRKQSIHLVNGETLSYDRLILAQGGDPFLPGVLAGPSCPGIFPVRNLFWARKTKGWLTEHRKVLVFGGSLVAVKTAVHFCQAGYEVTLVVRRGSILLRALSPEAAEIVENHLRRMGIRLCLHAPLEDIRVRNGQVAGLKAGGTWLDCDAVLVAAGIVPDSSFLADSGLLTDGELQVSPALQTRDPRIFAAGDTAVIVNARGKKISPNTWPQASAQGRLAGTNLYSAAPQSHQDSTYVNAMDLHGTAMVILGPPVPGAEVISYARPEEGIRREIFLFEGRPVGGALIGDISAAGSLRALLARGREAAPEAMRLLKIQTGRVIPFPAGYGPRKALIMNKKRTS